MANASSFKNVIDEIKPQVAILKKAIELDPAGTIEYQRALDFIETNTSVSSTIIKAIELVKKENNKPEAADPAPTKNEPSKKQKKADPAPKPTPAPAPVVNEEATDEGEDLFGMFN
ncbi:MAG: hypothetical protein D8G53_00605 [Candidatus Saccharimonas sp.]|nr:MAG: hypothetical protein D8G53_00605 [Candidatus Saccharimonas sp.]